MTATPGLISFRVPAANAAPPRASASAYEAASGVSQELAGWLPRLTSPDSEIRFERDIITARGRDLVRNSGPAAGGITRILDSVVGGDLRPSLKPLWRPLGLDAGWAREFAKEVEGNFRTWAYDPGFYCDASRHNTIGGLLGLGFRHQITDGDAIANLLWDPDSPGKFSTVVQLVDPDRLSNPDGHPDKPDFRGGIELTENGAATAYHFRRAHPNDLMVVTADAHKWIRVPRETTWGRPQVVHAFDKHRAGQTRGVSRLAPVMRHLKMLDKYDQVELQAALVNAVFAAYIESPFDHQFLGAAMEDPEFADELNSYQTRRAEFHDENRLKLNGVRVPLVFPGEKIVMPKAGHPNQNFEAFEGAVMRYSAAGLGITAEQFSQDWSKVNYSSARAALMEVWKTFSRDRLQFAARFAQPILGAFVEELWDARMLPIPSNAPDFWENKSAYCNARWIGPGRGWIDPLKEAQASHLRMMMGLSSLEREAADQGYDRDELLEERASDIDKFKELNLPLPTWANTAGIAGGTPSGKAGSEDK